MRPLPPPLTCEAGGHLFSRLQQLRSLQGALGVHILPPLQELSHSMLDLLRANPLHDLQTHKAGISLTHTHTHTWNTLDLCSSQAHQNYSPSQCAKKGGSSHNLNHFCVVFLDFIELQVPNRTLQIS